MDKQEQRNQVKEFWAKHYTHTPSVGLSDEAADFVLAFIEYKENLPTEGAGLCLAHRQG